MRQLGHVLLFAALLGPAVACRDEMAPDVDLVGVRSCQVGEYPLSGAPFVVDGPRQFIVSPAEVCPDINLEIAALAITVYHPQPLPDLGLPTVIMTNDVGLDATQYEHVLVPLAAQGFIVASVQTGGEVVERAAELSCALRWLRIDWSAEDQTVRPDQSPARFNCDLVLMGHGHGAEAAWIVGDNLRTIPWADVDPLGFDMQLRALVGLAPGFHRLSGYSPERSVPYLAIMGSTDERLPGAAIAAYDAMSSEAVATQDDPGKLILWPYDVPRAAFGGMPAASAGPDDAKGHAIAAAFVGAVMSGDLDAVRSMLHPDVVLTSDGGANRHAARRPVRGADRVARFLVNLARRLPPEVLDVVPVWVNGSPGMLVSLHGAPYMVNVIEVAGDRVVRQYSIVNPDKLASIGRSIELV